MHEPLLQNVFTAHRSVEVQATPLGPGTVAQDCELSTHTTIWHAGGVTSQSFMGPPTQRPATQLSSLVQKAPSSQAAPFGAGTTVHTPTGPGYIPSLHTAT
jgi:hypothetical protein